MKDSKVSDVLDDILDKIENPNIAVIGPGITNEFQIADASLFYYLNRLHNRKGKITIIDKSPRFFDFYGQDIGKINFPITNKFSFSLSDAMCLENTIKNQYDIISYHCTIPFISQTEETIKKAIDSGIKSIKNNGLLIFMSFHGESEYPPHKLFSKTTKILKLILSSDIRFNVKNFDIEDSYKIQKDAVKEEVVWPYYGCNTLTTATKL